MTASERVAAPASATATSAAAPAALPPGWARVRLGEVLRQRKEFIQIDDLTEYKRCRVQLHAQGIVLRDIVVGSEVKTKSQQVCRAGEFLVAEIDAKVGGFGVVPDALDGAIVSSHYFLFVEDGHRLDRRFLDWYVRTPQFQEQVSAQGSTNYAAIRPADVLTYTIPLPPLVEQRRIVARIEALAGRIAEARELRRQAGALPGRLLRSAIDTALDEWYPNAPMTSLEEIARSVTDGDHQPPPRADSGVPFILISNITTGTLDLHHCQWVSQDYFRQLHDSRVPRHGDVLYAAVGATYGTPCLVDTYKPFCFQRHIAIIRPDRCKVASEYLLLALRSTNVYQQATSYVTGSAQPTVPLRGIRRLRFPLPTLDEQQRIVAQLNALQVSCAQLARQHAESTTELNALLPAVLGRAFGGEL